MSDANKRRTRLGLAGERWAERALRAVGDTIVARRWRIVGGEIDLIAREQGDYVFVEVKTRRRRRFGPPQLAVPPRKLAHMATAATQWLAQTVGDTPVAWRIDVVAVELGRNDLPVRITIFQQFEV